MKFWISALAFSTLLLACKHKKKKSGDEVNMIPALSLLQSQVKQVDTSNLQLIRIQTDNGVSDTSLISKEEFRKAASEFLSLPDISSPKMKDNYDVSKSFDSLMNQVVMVYSANEPDEEIATESIIWGPDSTGNGEVKTIYINRVQESKDTVIEKELTWHMNSRFQVITKKHTPGGPQTVTIVKVRWK